MKTLAEINKTLEEFERRFGIPVVGAMQGSEAWYKLKLGVISASNASKVVAKKDSETRATYMAELVAQVCTGIMEDINAKAMDWGNQHEDAARSFYEFKSGHTMQQVPFVFLDTRYREGCSPDGLVTAAKGAEIKCPYNSAHFIKFLTDDKIKSEYVWQYQFTLRVMGADEWDFIQYDPRMKKTQMKVLTVTRDDDKQAMFDELIPAFIEDMDKMLLKIGVKFGDQWKAGALDAPKSFTELPNHAPGKMDPVQKGEKRAPGPTRQEIGSQILAICKERKIENVDAKIKAIGGKPAKELTVSQLADVLTKLAMEESHEAAASV